MLLRIQVSFDGDEAPHDKYQNEVNTLCKAYDFMQGRLNQFGKRKKINDFLQTVLDETFLRIRKEEINSPDEVLHTMLSVLSILQMKVNTNVILPLDTVLLHGLPSSSSRVELVQELSVKSNLSQLRKEAVDLDIVVLLMKIL